jgi:ADP-dependent phosphofructokinase/glucokinase
MEKETWGTMYQNVQAPRLQNAVVGFNVNLDRIITVTPELIRSPAFARADLAILRSRLNRSMQYCTAEEWFVSDPSQYRLFTDAFSDNGRLAIGGQAGIAALHLSTIGLTLVVCAAPALGTDAAGILSGAGVVIPDFSTGPADPAENIHLVFEYTPGLVPLADGVVPRNNRFIVSPVHDPGSVIIPEKSMERFLAQIAPCNRAFLSGYQYLRSGREFAMAADQILLMKKRNSGLRVHVECVSVTDEEILGGFVRHILPVADSIGLNEHELFLLLDFLNLSPLKGRKTGNPTPVQIAKGAVGICRNLGLMRLHLHTFGYYVLVLRRGCADPHESLNALLFASLEVAKAANGTSTEISGKGMRALGRIAGRYGPELSPGIFLTESFHIIIVPTIIARNIKKTVGLGDILSSTAFVADPF